LYHTQVAFRNHDQVVEVMGDAPGKLPNPMVPEYVELNSRLAWHATEQLEFALSGFNLLHGKHVEYAPGDAIPRSVYIETRFRF
jgi:hypothetical protein